MIDKRALVRTAAGLFGAVAVIALTLERAPAQTPATTSAPAKAGVHLKKTPAAAAAPLDLSAPPLNHIYPSKDLQYIMAYDPYSDDAPNEVSVKGTKPGVVVPGGPGNQFVAIPWALLHPTQAWRILTPIVQP